MGKPHNGMLWIKAYVIIPQFWYMASILYYIISVLQLKYPYECNMEMIEQKTDIA